MWLEGVGAAEICVSSATFDLASSRAISQDNFLAAASSPNAAFKSFLRLLSVSPDPPGDALWPGASTASHNEKTSSESLVIFCVLTLTDLMSKTWPVGLSFPRHRRSPSRS